MERNVRSDVAFAFILSDGREEYTALSIKDLCQGYLYEIRMDIDFINTAFNLLLLYDLQSWLLQRFGNIAIHTTCKTA